MQIRQLAQFCRNGTWVYKTQSNNKCRARTLLITPAFFSKLQMVNTRIVVNGHICEIQIAHQQMLAARKGLAGHAVFNRVRNVMELLDMTL